MLVRLSFRVLPVVNIKLAVFSALLTINIGFVLNSFTSITSSSSVRMQANLVIFLYTPELGVLRAAQRSCVLQPSLTFCISRIYVIHGVWLNISSPVFHPRSLRQCGSATMSDVAGIWFELRYHGPLSSQSMHAKKLSSRHAPEDLAVIVRNDISQVLSTHWRYGIDGCIAPDSDAAGTGARKTKYGPYL